MYRILKLVEAETPEAMKNLANKTINKRKGEPYRYITNHGIGPGTLPDEKGLYIKSEDLDGGKTAIYLSRPLTANELKKYDIKAEWIQEAEEDIETVSDDIEASEDIEDTLDSEENQEENPVEEESALNKELDELREILVDLDLNLYQLTDKEDTNNNFYIIGKVAEDSDDVLMLTDTKPEDAEEFDEEKRWNFVKIPNTFEQVATMGPRYGEELTPDHEAIVTYLMNCLIETNPEAAKELQKDDIAETTPEDIEAGMEPEEEVENED